MSRIWRDLLRGLARFSWGIVNSHPWAVGLPDTVISNETEWLATDDPEILFVHLRVGLAPRKRGLISCAFCRRRWEPVADRRFEYALGFAERIADGKATFDEFRIAWNNEFDYQAWQDLLTRSAIGEATVATMGEVAYPNRGWFALTLEARLTEANLVRCIVGNPFRTLRLDPSWLAWNQQTVPALAEAIYTDRAFDRLPILADALEEAGCDNGDILNHCRSPSPHARGCWVVDLLLGK